MEPAASAIAPASRAEPVVVQPPRLRIVHVVGRSQRRGAEIAALELAAELDRRGHHNRVVAMCPQFDGSREPALAPLTARRQMDLVGFVAGVLRLRRALRRDPADIVLAHGGWAMQVAAVARRRDQTLIWQRILAFPPAFWGEGPRRALQRRWWRWVARRGGAGVALTAELRDELHRLGFAAPVWIIANSRDPRRFSGVDRAAAGRRLRDELGLDPDTRLIGLVGHLIEQKRPERALTVLDEVRRHGVDAHLVVAGDGPLRQGLQSDIGRRGLSASVTILGQRDDVEWVLAGIDLLVLVSESEGIPGVVIEAQMAGCPVVTYPLGGVEQVVIDGITGVVTGRAEPELMAEAVARLLADPGTRGRLGEAAVQRAAAFSVDRAAARYEAGFLDVLGVTHG